MSHNRPMDPKPHNWYAMWPLTVSPERFRTGSTLVSIQIQFLSVGKWDKKEKLESWPNWDWNQTMFRPNKIRQEKIIGHARPPAESSRQILKYETKRRHMTDERRWNWWRLKKLMNPTKTDATGEDWRNWRRLMKLAKTDKTWRRLMKLAKTDELAS